MHIDNNKKDILIINKGPTNGLDDTMLTTEKQDSIKFTKQQQNFCLSLHYKGANTYILVNNIEIYKFKAKDFEINSTPLCLGNVSKVFSVYDMKKT